MSLVSQIGYCPGSQFSGGSSEPGQVDAIMRGARFGELSCPVLLQEPWAVIACEEPAKQTRKTVHVSVLCLRRLHKSPGPRKASLDPNPSSFRLDG
jgi:hypothetical protein